MLVVPRGEFSLAPEGMLAFSALYQVVGDVSDDAEVGCGVAGAHSAVVVAHDDVEHQCSEFSMPRCARTKAAATRAVMIAEAKSKRVSVSTFAPISRRLSTLITPFKPGQAWRC